MNEFLKAKLLTLPLKPGCYLMKDKDGQIIYVGKAKNLKSRVNSYFAKVHEYKTAKLVSNIFDFEYIVTPSEKDALVLEVNLIKKHRPRYNILYMDDKSYPYIKLTMEKYPQLKVVRDAKKDRKSRYFGPYPDAWQARKMIALLNQLYPLRKCHVMPKKVCLYYHINQCLGPCEFKIKESVYEKMRADIIKVLKGDTKDLVEDLNQKMMFEVERMEYEKAKEYRDLIQSITYVTQAQQMQYQSKQDQDIFHCYYDKGYLSIQGLLIRNGQVINRTASLAPLYEETEDAFISFISQYYLKNPLPDEILVSDEFDYQSLSEEIIEKMHFPKRGQKKALLDMAMTNAKQQLTQKFQVLEKIDHELTSANEQLNILLNQEIHTVELFDNSHISGQFAVAAMVCYKEGVPSKKDYRLYQLHQGNNDLESMKEVVYRRYFRLLKENLLLPDLILVDGGSLQIDAAKTIIDALGLQITVCGLVKDQKHSTSAIMNANHELLPVEKDSPLFFLLTRMQDEVHRFAITYHKKLRSKAQTKSILLDIPKVGEKTQKSLLKHFGSFKKIKEATLEQLKEVVNEEVAQNIIKYLNS